MATAFVLLTVSLGTEEEVLHKLREIVGIKSAYQIYGIYDIIARVEGGSADDVKHTLQEKVRRLGDVRNTLTLMVV